MDVQNFLAWVLAIVAAAESLRRTIIWARKQFSGVWNFVNDLSWRLNEIWEFLKIRGEMEAVERGLATLEDGHLILKPEIRARFDPIAAALKGIASEAYDPSNSNTLMSRISQKYKRWLIANVCLPLDLRDMTCIRMAMAVATEGQRDASNAS